jgi:Uma2 family endonuclease
MASLVLDPNLESRLKAERELSGADRYDEVWEGTYMMSPLADFEHQQIQFRLGAAVQMAVGWDSKVIVLAGVNVSDRDEDWTHNYRCPDVAVYFPNTSAQIREAHTVGGPDFAVEIVSSHDRSRQKLDFYAAVRVRELLLIDRDPWSLELYRLDSASGKLVLAARCAIGQPGNLISQVVPLTFTLEPTTPRPTIVVTQHNSPARWNI